MSNRPRQKLFICECGDISHQFVLSYYPDDKDWDEAYIEIFLTDNCGFWKRLWYGIKYIFGYKSRFGAFDEILLSHDTAKELKESLNEYIENYEKNHTK